MDTRPRSDEVASGAPLIRDLAAGTLWAGLTLGFEILLGVAMNLDASRLLSDYLPWRGGFMAFGLLFMAAAPRLAAKLRGI